MTLTVYCGTVSSDITFGSRARVTSEDSVNDTEQWVRFTRASVSKIIKIKCPDHAATQAHAANIVGLVSDHGCIIKRDPLISWISIRPHSALRIFHHLPASLLNIRANLERKLQWQYAIIHNLEGVTVTGSEAWSCHNKHSQLACPTLLDCTASWLVLPYWIAQSVGLSYPTGLHSQLACPALLDCTVSCLVLPYWIAQSVVLSCPTALHSQLSCPALLHCTASWLVLPTALHSQLVCLALPDCTASWLVLPYCTAQLTLSSVKLCFSLSKIDCFCGLWNEPLLQSLMQHAVLLSVYGQ